MRMFKSKSNLFLLLIFDWWHCQMHHLPPQRFQTHIKECSSCPVYKSIGENQNIAVNPIMWHSKKIQKVVVNTLSAEAMSLAGAVNVLAWIRLYWAWILDGKCQWQTADETLLRLPPAFAAIPPSEETRSSQPPLSIQHSLATLPENSKAIITTDCKSL